MSSILFSRFLVCLMADIWIFSSTQLVPKPIKLNMVRVILGLLFCLGCCLVHAGEIRKIEINQTPLYYHFCQGSKPASKLIIFLHGAVAAYQGQTESTPKEIINLVESNIDFINTLTENGYDVILPIAYNDYNWLAPKGELYLDSLMNQYQHNYTTIHLAGFSDGATGAYKYFYTHPDRLQGLWLFNGFPQHQNFNKKVDPTTFTDYDILYVSQKNDKIIPYEFLLTEYRRQKITNGQTYFILLEGKHEFTTYTRSDFETCLDLLENHADEQVLSSDSIWIYPPADGFMVDNALVEIYSFRTSIARNFGMDKNVLATNLSETQKLEVLLKQGSPLIMPLKINRKDLSQDTFTFSYVIQGNSGTIQFQNYFLKQTW